MLTQSIRFNLPCIMHDLVSGTLVYIKYICCMHAACLFSSSPPFTSLASPSSLLFLLWGFQSLGSVERLETTVIVIELNCTVVAKSGATLNYFDYTDLCCSVRRFPVWESRMVWSFEEGKDEKIQFWCMHLDYLFVVLLNIVERGLITAETVS